MAPRSGTVQTMWSRDLAMVLAAVACLFLNYPVLLIVGPVALREAGGEAGQAGILTALFSQAHRYRWSAATQEAIRTGGDVQRTLDDSAAAWQAIDDAVRAGRVL